MYGAQLPCVTRPSAPTVLHGFPEGRLCWTLGVDGRVAHGRRVSPKPRVPMVLRSFLRECCVGLWGGGGGGHGPQYQKRGVARAPCALCACARPLRASHVNPLSKNPLAVVLPGTAPNEHRGVCEGCAGGTVCERASHNPCRPGSWAAPCAARCATAFGGWRIGDRGVLNCVLDFFSGFQIL